MVCKAVVFIIIHFHSRFDLIVQHSIQEVKRDPCFFSKHKTTGKGCHDDTATISQLMTISWILFRQEKSV